MSSDHIEFTVPGDPFGKERPKAARRGKFVTVYTPKKTVAYENKVRKAYLKENRGNYIYGAVEANINAFHRIPKSTSKANRQKMLNDEIPCTVKPDADNIAKCILDPLNGLAFKDDNHVTKLAVLKRYSIDPRVEVSLSPYIPGIVPFDIFPLEFY